MSITVSSTDPVALAVDAISAQLAAVDLPETLQRVIWQGGDVQEFSHILIGADPAQHYSPGSGLWVVPMVVMLQLQPADYTADDLRTNWDLVTGALLPATSQDWQHFSGWSTDALLIKGVRAWRQMSAQQGTAWRKSLMFELICGVKP
jgi:hypothetical protein